MMQLARRAPLIIVLLLLAPVSLVFGECEWLLWNEAKTSRAEWRPPVTALGSRSDDAKIAPHIEESRELSQ